MQVKRDSDGCPIQCRHCGVDWEWVWEYCPKCERNYGGAVYPAKSTQQELDDARKVAEIIRAAFADVRLGDGMTIHEADLEGVYDDDQVRLDARAKDPERDWTEVPDWKLSKFDSALSFFDIEGWRFHIPAYMCWVLRNWRTSESNSIDTTIWDIEDRCDYFPERRDVLSREQCEAVYRFLEFFDEYSGEPDAAAALDHYWGKFRPASS